MSYKFKLKSLFGVNRDDKATSPRAAKKSLPYDDDDDDSCVYNTALYTTTGILNISLSDYSSTSLSSMGSSINNSPPTDSAIACAAAAAPNAQTAARQPCSPTTEISSAAPPSSPVSAKPACPPSGRGRRNTNARRCEALAPVEEDEEHDSRH